MTHPDRLMAIAGQLSALSRETGARFSQIADELSVTVDPDALLHWGEICLEIAESGWHAWESTNAYLDLAIPLAHGAGSQALLAVGGYGRGLCGFSYEPGTSYFRGIGHLIAHDMLAHAGEVERAGLVVREHFQHASNLIADYYRVGFGIAAQSDEAGLGDWRDVAISMADRERAELAGFLNAAESAAGLDWLFLKQLNQESVDNGLEYLAAHPALHKLLGDERLADLQVQTLGFAGKDVTLGPWFTALISTLDGLQPIQRDLLVSLMDDLPSTELSMSLMAAVPRLPLGRPRVMRQWIAGVTDFLPLNLPAAAGYLGLESAKSQDRLESLMGQVNLSDCQRVLQLYSEAIAGKRLRIEATTFDVDYFRQLPTTDGLSVFLPETIDRYPATEDNFALYKISLLHQLGYYDFGTFDLLREQRVESFAECFASFTNPALARDIFQLAEDARIDWALAARYRGAEPRLAWFKARAIEELAERRAPQGIVEACLGVLLVIGLDGDEADCDASLDPGLVAALGEAIMTLRVPAADVYRTLDVVAYCHDLISENASTQEERQPGRTPVIPVHQPPEPPDFRGKLEPDTVRVNLQLAALEEEQEAEMVENEEEGLSLTSMVDPKDLKINEVKKGDVDNAMGMTLTDMDIAAEDIEEADPAEADETSGLEKRLKQKAKTREQRSFQYDEWDSVISDYRRRWCTLFEITDVDEKPEFVRDTLAALRQVSNNVRRQLSHLRPELLRKVKGVEDGEELDLEKTVEAIVDKRAGTSPSERIYVQRQRKERDVSALFLLDMSASTDDRIPLPEAQQPDSPPKWDEDDFLHDYYGAQSDADSRKRIIDIEKEAVVLMADALEDLGDSYSVCGFSGYGRDQVDYYVCKDFEDPYNHRAKGRIGGIKPCRSTRMGPAIRHATRRLVATESRIKALIIISDGYPQDFDYGKDRNSRDYGIKDTTMALTEARQKGVQAFCLTVDPSGHDYLREMCPDQQYMVIQDINQLPDELSKVYRSLTA